VAGCVLLSTGPEKSLSVSVGRQEQRAWLTGYCINLVRVRYSKLLWIEVETGFVLIRLTGWPAVPLRTFNNENFDSGKFIETIHLLLIVPLVSGRALFLLLMIPATAFVLLRIIFFCG